MQGICSIYTQYTLRDQIKVLNGRIFDYQDYDMLAFKLTRPNKVGYQKDAAKMFMKVRRKKISGITSIHSRCSNFRGTSIRASTAIDIGNACRHCNRVLQPSSIHATAAYLIIPAPLEIIEPFFTPGGSPANSKIIDERP